MGASGASVLPPIWAITLGHRGSGGGLGACPHERAFVGACTDHGANAQGAKRARASVIRACAGTGPKNLLRTEFLICTSRMFLFFIIC